MRVKLKTESDSKVFASDLEVGTWFLDIDRDTSLVVNNFGMKRILCFATEHPFMRKCDLSWVEVRRVIEPNELEICE